jgi:chromosome segregation ATPase
LTALGKLVDSHSQRLNASDEERGKQFEAIGQVHNAISQLTNSVERSVSAMEKAVEASSHSQRATENLTRLLQQQHNDLRQQLEKLSSDQTKSLAGRIVEDLSAKIFSRQAGAQPSPTSAQVETPAAGRAQQGPWGAPEVQNPEAPADKKWWPLR